MGCSGRTQAPLSQGTVPRDGAAPQEHSPEGCWRWGSTERELGTTPRRGHIGTAGGGDKGSPMGTAGGTDPHLHHSRPGTPSTAPRPAQWGPFFSPPPLRAARGWGWGLEAALLPGQDAATPGAKGRAGQDAVFTLPWGSAGCSHQLHACSHRRPSGPLPVPRPDLISQPHGMRLQPPAPQSHARPPGGGSPL